MVFFGGVLPRGAICLWRAGTIRIKACVDFARNEKLLHGQSSLCQRTHGAGPDSLACNKAMRNRKSKAKLVKGHSGAKA